MSERSSDSSRRQRHGSVEEPTSDSADAAGAIFAGAVALPSRIGRFRLSRVIAAGGMGTVYLAEQDQPHRLVALKLMQPNVASTQAIQRFERESELLGRMHHPNIAQVYEAGIHREAGVEIPYYAMEYIAGAKPITTYVQENNLSIEEILKLFAEVCDAVHHGHQRGVIHRDLKPGNILIDAAGRPKVIDFGVARATDADLAVTLHTRTGQIIGTIAYMSPEQLAGDPHQIDARSDVYALGVLLYEMLCGKLPHNLDGAPVHDAARIIREQEPDRPSTITSAVRGDLQTIILTALAKERNRRYQTPDALRQDILRWLRGETIIARPPTITYLIATRCRRLARTHPAVAMLLMAVVLGLLGSVGGSALMYGRYAGYVTELYMSALIATMPPPAAMDELHNVRIIRLTDHTMKRVPELASRFQMPQVTPEEMRSMRRLHGRLMQRLAEVGVSAVVWDFRFPMETSHDREFLLGVDALYEAEAGVAVVIGEWKGDPELTEMHISPALLAHPHIRRGVAVARFLEIGPELDLLAMQGRYEVPSLILAGFALRHHPTGRIRYSLDQSWRRTANVTCYVHDDPDRPHIERIEHHFEVPLSGIVHYDEPTSGLAPGDATGAIVITVPNDDVIARISMDYDEIFELDAETLRRNLQDKVVVIADYREGRDQHDHFGRSVFGGDVVATGIEALFHGSRWILRWENPIVTSVVAIMASFVGVLVAAVSGGRPGRWLALTAVTVLVIVAACMLGYPLFRFILNPLMPVVVMVVAAAGGAAVLRV